MAKKRKVGGQIRPNMTSSRFRRLRESIGLTQTELGSIFGYGHDAGQVVVSDYENGRRPIPNERAVHLQMLVDERFGKETSEAIAGRPAGS